MKVTILGTGCKKCVFLEERVKEIIKKHQIEAEVEKVTEIDKIVAYGIMMTPGLAVDDEVKSSGYIPKEEQILEWLKK